MKTVATVTMVSSEAVNDVEVIPQWLLIFFGDEVRFDVGTVPSDTLHIFLA